MNWSSCWDLVYFSCFKYPRFSWYNMQVEKNTTKFCGSSRIVTLTYISNLCMQFLYGAMYRLLSSQGYYIREVQYIPSDMCTVLLCFVLLWLYYQLFVIHMMYLPIFFRVASLALEQSYDCSITSDVTLKKEMGKISRNKTRQSITVTS